MEKYIIISSLNNLTAILQDGCLNQFTIQSTTYQLGNIYLGSVSRIFPTIKAIFVTIQINRKYKNGFIHVTELVSRNGSGRLASFKAIVIKQKLYVQVIKEAFFGKNPRLTQNINIPGRYLVFSPTHTKIYVSRKISSYKERDYLKSLSILLFQLSMGGLFIKYNASRVSDKVIIEEWKILKKRWNIILKLVNHKSFLKSMVLYQDCSILKRVIRDFNSVGAHRIFVDTAYSLKKLQLYLDIWQISNSVTRIYAMPENILDNFQLHSGIARISNCRVNLHPAGYILIEHFEALTVIDINSGILDRCKYPAGFILILNCTAAKEIMYQIRMRDISGIILIDFIDMLSKKDRLELLRYMHRLFRSDVVTTQVIQLSELGLIEITRKRDRKNLLEALSDYNAYFFFKRTLSSILDLIKYNTFLYSVPSYLSSKILLNRINSYNDYNQKMPIIKLMLKPINSTRRYHFLNSMIQSTPLYLC